MKFFKTIAAVLITVSLISCNPAKRMQKEQQQYEAMVNDYIAKHPPRIDTATKYLPGKIWTRNGKTG